MEEIEFRIGRHVVLTKPAIKYLGIILDKRLSMKAHLQHAQAKAAATVTALSRMMLNTRGPKQRRRQLLANVVKSQILYRAPIWWKAIECPSYCRGISSTYRLCALRVASAFRTVSDEAALVISGMPPVTLLAKEAGVLSAASRPLSATERTRIRSTLISEWQSRWDNSAKGRWTHRCIPKLGDWISRRHGEVSFYLCQFLSGHGCFKSYLYKYKHDSDPYCGCCPDSEEDAFHVFLSVLGLISKEMA